jgi:hypothetical protein
MTVTFVVRGQQSIIEEIFAATLQAKTLTLRGVNYTYVEQGGSRSYSLDSFALERSPDGSTLTGKALLLNGEQPIVFKRAQ